MVGWLWRGFELLSWCRQARFGLPLVLTHGIYLDGDDGVLERQELLEAEASIR